MIPEHLKYTKEHEWALVTENGNVRFGITHHAQDSLGDIVFVSLPNPGDQVEAGQPCGEIESTKSVAEVYSPVGGEVAARNDVVETSPETINEDPYGNGWLLEVTGPADLSELLSAQEYADFVAAQ